MSKYKIPAAILFWGGALMAGVGFIMSLQAGGVIAVTLPSWVFVSGGVLQAMWAFVASNASPDSGATEAVVSAGKVP